jgi:hypothetical protein
MANLKKVKFVLLLGLFLFIAIGYIDCDAMFYRKIIAENNINTPEDALNHINKTIKRFSTEDIGKPNSAVYRLPMRDILEQKKGFWCDQGAILLGNILEYTAQKYPYRLVNILGMDSVSHHTVLEVFEEGDWKLYDVVPLHKSHLPHCGGHIQSCVDYKILRPDCKKWSTTQKIYHFLIENNNFIKYFLFKIRNN